MDGMRHRILLAVALTAGPLASAPAFAAEDGFIDRFDGSWGGGGVVMRNEDSGPTKVNCSLSGEGENNQINIAGSCRAYLIFTRNVRVDVVYDPASDRYSGTYVGSKIGTARLSGKRHGDQVDLTLTWPKKVMGDTTAKMTIINSGNGQLRVLVNDKVGGGVRPVTDLALANS